MGGVQDRTEDGATRRRTDTPLDPTSRLRIATRIHFALLRHYAEDVAVSSLLAGGADAREALWVCEASGLDELVQLAKQFGAAPKTLPKPAAARTVTVAPRGAVPQEMAWAQDTSGFGVTRAPDLAEAPQPAPKTGRWPNPARWLRGAR
jgi:hypothetical protein